MREVPIKLGPLALLLTVISICLTTLAILTFTTARADYALAEKYSETVRERYEMETAGQAYLREVDADLRQGVEYMTDGDGVLWKTIEGENARLLIGLTFHDGTYAIDTWRIERQWAEDSAMGNLWSGN